MWLLLLISVPRLRGDEPYRLRIARVSSDVFPAYAGMNRIPMMIVRCSICVPRLRGDEPDIGLLKGLLTGCSPPTRG